MIYYYKQIDEQGNLKTLLTCSIHLDSSEEQIEISKEEYDFLMAEFLKNVSSDFGINYNLA